MSDSLHNEPEPKPGQPKFILWLALGGLATLAALAAVVMLLFHPPSKAPAVHQVKRDGFRFDAWYFPEGLYPTDIVQSAVPGSLNFFVDLSNDSTDQAIGPMYALFPFSLGANGLVALPELDVRNIAKQRIAIWPDGRALVQLVAGEPDDPLKYALVDLKHGSDDDSSATARFVVPADWMPEWRAFVHGKLVVLQAATEAAGATDYDLLVCPPDTDGSVITQLHDVDLFGEAWQDGERSIALLTTKHQLLIYDGKKQAFIEHSELAKMAAVAPGRTDKMRPFVLARDFGVFRDGTDWLAITLSGSQCRIPIRPDELSDNAPGQRSPGLAGAFDPKAIEKAKSRQSGEYLYKGMWRKYGIEGRTAPPDKVCFCSWPNLVAEDTVAFPDWAYARTVLLRLDISAKP